MRTAVFPGSFNPCTVAHLAVADAAYEQLDVDIVHLVLSEAALGKDPAGVPSSTERANDIRSARQSRPWLDAQVTTKQYLADIAAGHDWLIVGVDKWHQLIDASWFASPDDWAASLHLVRGVAVVPRSGDPGPTPEDIANLHERLERSTPAVVVLSIDPALAHVSSSAVRAGRDDWHARPR